ncbi:DUF3054 domain-containing protein [Halorarum salinum]|uniref:DUF3054 domain-containing protein n=1 Tax=Halorarum salinum TaxID=2743089 RepID=A0A7D5QHX6_9EURY|nr:DUF3054 domain-containing protein [Halobaculum salinum]QLG62524.1 DUF3054 domain-containing protein [Halobaculum salinum]
MAVADFLDRRVDAGALPLVLGDVLVILAFIYAGSTRHQSVAFPPAGAQDLVTLLVIAAPFLVGWAIAAPLVGAYSAGAVESAKASVPLTIRSWIPAAVIGLALRATPWVEGGVALAFALVMLVVGSVSLAVWRVVAARFV